MTLQQQALLAYGHVQARKIERTWWCWRCRRDHARDEVKQAERDEVFLYVCRATGEIVDENDTPF